MGVRNFCKDRQAMGSSRSWITSLACSLWIITTTVNLTKGDLEGRESLEIGIFHENYNHDFEQTSYDEDHPRNHPKTFNSQYNLDQDSSDQHHCNKTNHQHHHSIPHHHQDELDEDTYKESKIFQIPLSVWLAGIGSVIGISLVGLLAVGVVPLLKGPHQDMLLQLLVSLAVGTLVGDALIHLLPHALETGHGEAGAVWKGFVATMTIIAFYLLDRLLEVAGHYHRHTHLHSDMDVEVCKNSKGDLKNLLKTHGLYHSYKSIRKDSHLSMSNSSLMVIVGDAVHNFADGLAIGAAFSISIAAGLSTSLAVLCHELPHEVGDFALLFHAGMPIKVAVFYNCVSSIFALIGLITGLLLGVHSSFSSWLLSATVGVFLYVALVSMMTELQSRVLDKAVLNTMGMMSGAVLLLFIGLYEHDLVSFFTNHQHHNHH